MIAIMIGALVIPPFLGHTGSSLIGSRVYAQAIDSEYACDSGVEHAVWNLTDGGITANISSPGETVSYALPESINGLGTTVKICNSYEVLAADNFESGGWTGGSGWLDSWTHAGEADVVDTGTPFQGVYHLRLRADTGAVSRSIDLSREVNTHLCFWAKVGSFESGETATCDVSANGADWTTVHTWTTAVDDAYHYYDIDLSSYSRTSRLWIAFNSRGSNTGDYFYVDALEVVWLAAAPQTVAMDNFESGDWTGGSGWIGAWTHAGDAAIDYTGAPYEGDCHLRLGSTGMVKRSVDLANETLVRLHFWAKVNSFESFDRATCRISSDNATWTTVYTWTTAADDNTYHYYDIDLSLYSLTSRFWIAFDADMDAADDYFYVDDLDIVSLKGFGITSAASDRVIKAAVDIRDGAVNVLYWYFV